MGPRQHIPRYHAFAATDGARVSRAVRLQPKARVRAVTGLPRSLTIGRLRILPMRILLSYFSRITCSTDLAAAEGFPEAH